jgi:hypothetical protein
MHVLIRFSASDRPVEIGISRVKFSLRQKSSPFPCSSLHRPTLPPSLPSPRTQSLSTRICRLLHAGQSICLYPISNIEFTNYFFSRSNRKNGRDNSRSPGLRSTARFREVTPSYLDPDVVGLADVDCVDQREIYDVQLTVLTDHYLHGHLQNSTPPSPCEAVLID